MIENDNKRNVWAAMGALHCAIAVALGAVFAHGFELTLEMAHKVGQGLMYHCTAGIGLIILSLQPQSRIRLLALLLLTIGSIFFPFSIYALAAGYIDKAPLAPMGGSSLILGWLAAGLYFLLGNFKKNS